MRALLFVTALISALGFTQAAMACTNIERVSADAPEHVFKAGDCIRTVNGKYTLNMQADGNLALYDEHHPGHVLLWQADLSGPAAQGNAATLKSDGSLVVSDSAGKELWRAKTQIPAGKSSANYYLTIGKTGRLEMFQGSSPMDLAREMVWVSQGELEADVNGDCQCHITNTNGSPGKASGDPFKTCGVVACLSTCKGKNDYFGDALVSIYRNGTGKCRAF